MEKNDRQLSLNSLAAIHVGGSDGHKNVTNRMFGRSVAQLALMGKFSLYLCSYSQLCSSNVNITTSR